MFSESVQNSVRFIFLILLQALILNDWVLTWGIQPFLYILFILMLPFETPRWTVLIIGFICGMTMDAFENTMGMHASAATLLAFIRRPILDWIAPRDGYETGMKPIIRHMGAGWYLRYAGILTLIHHVWLYGLELFRLSEFHAILSKGTLSAIFTIALIFLYQYLIHGSPGRERRWT